MENFTHIQVGSTKYLLSKRIAKGGMAEIYIAKIMGEEGFYKICAIKRILPQYSQEEEFLKMFRTEANICKSLQHTNIVQVLDFVNLSGSYAIVMEYVDGSDLRNILSSCENAGVRLSVPMIVYITAMIARALHYTHVKRDDITGKPLELIHRDISPQNILISFEGDVKLTDFGIADFESKNIETQPGVVKGKYSYMSPEQISGKKLDYHTDVFSLAIVCWEALAMRRLFAGNGEIETIKNVQTCRYRGDLRELNNKVDDTLYSIIMKELSLDKSKRFSSAAAFEKALLKYLYTSYPDFSVIELSNFLKKLLAQKREENQAIIKALIETPVDKIENTNNQNIDVSSEPITKGDMLDLYKILLNNNNNNKSNSPNLFTNSSTSRVINSLNSSVKSSISTDTPSNNHNSTNDNVNRPLSNLDINPIKTKDYPVSFLQNMGTMNTMSSIGSNMYNKELAMKNFNLHKKKKSSLSLLFPLSILVILFLAGYYFFTSNYQGIDLLKKNNEIKVRLTTIPATVKIKVGNFYLNKGALIKTPTTISNDGKDNIITIEKENYISQHLHFNKELNDKTIILKKGNELVGILDIIVKQKRPIHVEFDNDQNYKAPVSILNVNLNKPHTLKVYPLYPNKNKSFVCNINLKNKKSRLSIDLISSSCSLGFTH